MALTHRHFAGRTQWEYWDALHFACRMAGYKLKPSHVYCDFEKGLINAVRECFPDACIVGCLFHFKQALRRHMITKLKIDEDQVDMAMEKNCLDILTITPKAEIKKKGVPCVKQVISTIEMTKEDEEKWELFWAYFEKFWCSSDEFIACWNIHDETKKGKKGDEYYDLHNRTNNGMER